MGIVLDRILDLREQHEMTQQELAKAISVSQATVSRLEKSDQDPTDFRLLTKIAQAFELPVSELVQGTDLERLIGRTCDQDAFLAFCPNPFCRSNEFKRDENGDDFIYWTSSKRYSISMKQEINFCGECGEDLVKECSNCKRSIEKSNQRFCVQCGQQLVDRPTKNEWAGIHRVLDMRHAKAEADSTKKQQIDHDDIPF